MRRVLIGLGAGLLTYVGVGALLHIVMFPEPSPPSWIYPDEGDTFGSQWEGVAQKVLRRDGDRLWLELTGDPGAPGPPEHVHISFDEEVHVQSGTLTTLMDGEKKRLGPGESLLIPAGTPHTFTNETDEPVVVRGWLPRKFALFLSQAYPFLDEAEANTRPPRILLQMSLFQADTWLARLPVPAQRALYFVLAPTARLLGYRSYYERYAPGSRPIP